MVKRKVVILSVLFLIIVLAAIYFTWFFSYSCEDIPCFQSHQKKCVATKYIQKNSDTELKYQIKGKNGDSCEIDITVLKIREGTVDRKVLEGKTMACFVPLGNTNSPEDNLDKCEGKLKEELQGLIIQNLHAYILENLGEIREELNKVL